MIGAQRLLTWIRRLLPAVLCVAACPAELAAQDYTGGYSGYSGPGYYPAAVDAIASRIHAVADYTRSTGDRAVSMAEARRIHETAYRLEIINSVDRLKAYWKRKTIGEQQLRLRHYNHLKSKRLRNSKTWQRLRDHPDLNGPSIVNGR